MPDDADTVVRSRRPERPGRVGTTELGARARCVVHGSFRDRDVVERLPVVERHLAEGPAEVTDEVERDQLVDDEAAVAADLDDDLGGREREGFRGGVPGERKRPQRDADR